MKTHNSSAGQMLRVALLASSAGLAMTGWAAPALAQDTNADNGEAAAIVITGSRIARRDYTATSPIVTVDADLIDKSASVNLEANLNKLPQFAPAITQFADASGRGDIQANANNTLGATTVSLRQLGSNRNIVLIDGRRPTPINGTGVVDINSVPSAAIERVEVITGGASSTYGADAVGGVVNFILKKNFKGFSMDGQIGLSEHGDGREGRIATLIGASFDDGRGNVILGMEHYDRQPVLQFDREAYRKLYSAPGTAGNTIFGLEQDYALFPGGNPSQTAVNSLFAGKGAPAGVNVPVTQFYFNGNGTLFANTSVNVNNVYTPLLLGYDQASSGTIDGVKRKVGSNGLLRDNYLDQYLSTPQTRWSFFAKGQFELNEYITAVSQVYFVRTRVHTRNLVPPAITSWGVLIPHGTGTYTGDASLGIASSLMADNVTTNPDYRAGGKYGLSCPATGGCTNSMVFPTPTELTTLLDSRGTAANSPFEINKFLTQVGERFTDNNNINFQMMAGFEGRVPGTDWTWEIYGSHGETVAKTDQNNFASVLRWRAVLSAPNYGRAFQYKGNSGTPGGGFQGSTGKCTSGVNPFTTPNWSADCVSAVVLNLQNENRLTQDIVEGNLQGGLFDLPYGQLRFALGADYRKNSIAFRTDSATTEGTSFLEPVNGVYPQGNTSGSISVKEVYGELLVPLLADLPFVKALNLELGYRLSDYSTVGSVSTYKINGEYAPVRWLRFRGGYQRASRAPNLGELFTAATSTLGSSADGDPCSRANPAAPTGLGNYSANPIGKDSELQPIANDTNGGNPDAAKVEALCRQIMGTEGANQYYIAGRVYSPVTAGFAFPTLLGNLGLKEETATTYTIGAVITSPVDSPWLRRLSLAIDYYNVNLSNAIAQGGPDAIYRRCFAKQYNPTYSLNSYCQLIDRVPATGEVGTIKVSFANAGKVETSGVDAQLNWALNFKDAGIGLPGTFNVGVQATYLLRFATTTDDGIIPLTDWAGSNGPPPPDVGTNAGAYRWKLFTTFGYSVGPVTASLQWQHKPSVVPYQNIQSSTNNYNINPAYDLFNLAATVAVTRNATIRFGADNLFDKQPPIVGVNLNATGAVLPGGTYDNGNYDVLGRRFYIGANFKF